jgi:hypothetical protein
MYTYEVKQKTNLQIDDLNLFHYTVEVEYDGSKWLTHFESYELDDDQLNKRIYDFIKINIVDNIFRKPDDGISDMFDAINFNIIVE